MTSRDRLARALAAAMMVMLALMAGSGRAAASESPISAHSMLQLTSPPSFMAAMFAEAAAMHASYLRMDVAPALIFTAPGQAPDFSGLDEVVALSQQYHVPVVGDLLSIPWWIASCPDQASQDDLPHCATGDLTGYASMIAQIASRADPVIRDWEIWNEPDSGAFFHGTPQQYALMLRADHDAIAAVDPQERVLLGGMSGTGAIPWLAQVLATPGADAVHSFDIATIHERAPLDALAGDVEKWRLALAAGGFTGPLWVTEHGYPSDASFQYDASYAGGPAAQASYLAASVPTLLDAGAAQVFVTERDNLTGQFGSEGVLGGDVGDPGVPDPQVVEKPAFGVVQEMAGCYVWLGRDCPSAEAVATPGAVALPTTALGASAMATVTISNPGPAPVSVGAAVLAGGSTPGLSVARDGCSGQILEPNRPCTIALVLHAVAGGAVATALQVPAGDGTVTVPVTATVPSVSALTPAGGAPDAFTPTDHADGVGYSQRRTVTLRNPLAAPVRVARTAVAGADAARFAVDADTCAVRLVPPSGTCRVSLLFTPTRPGPAHAALRLSGDGAPLTLALAPGAAALPDITHLIWPGSAGCLTAGDRGTLAVLTDQPGAVRWIVARAAAPAPRRCAVPAPAALGRMAAVGTRRTGRRTIRLGARRGYVTRLRPAIHGGRPLAPGVYRLTLVPVNGHGAGAPRAVGLVVP